VHDELSQLGITSVNFFLADITLLAPDTAAMAKRSSHREPAPPLLLSRAERNKS
jgi:hypothetical protein